MKPITKKEALLYHHLDNRPGKTAIKLTKPIDNQRELSLAYTPGVAYPVLEIAKNPKTAFEFTSRGNLVGVISNGTAILGLGNKGALASKPVMEGKAALFKKFANIDVFDIEIAETDPDKLISTIESLEPTFGGINLEDIKSPECFYIESELKKKMEIPVFHDDQHGTAVILGAAFINALDLTGKKITEIKIVFSGAGAAGIACATHLIRLGVPVKNIWMCDIAGLVFHGRKNEMFPEKNRFAQGDIPKTLEEVIQGADVFIGLSVGNILSEEMLSSMRSHPIIFAMANPTPEIDYELAKQSRPDAIIATGRSDYPNQINNLLGFPFIFRGALDVRARTINDEMVMAASQALAKLAKEPVPKTIADLYGISSLEFGPDYIVPKPLDRRVYLWESYAVAKSALESGVAQDKILPEDYLEKLNKDIEEFK